MQFSQTAAVPQLYQATDNGAAAPGTVLYLLPQNTQSLPAAISFAAAWNLYTGVYIFLESALAPGTEQAFAQAAWNFLSDPRQQSTRFAWFNPPDSSGLLTGPTIGVYQPGGGPPGPGSMTSGTALFSFQNVLVSIGRNTPVAADVGNFAFTFTNSSTISLNAAWGSVTAGTVGAAVQLPLAGNLAGCLQFSVVLSGADLDSLDVGLRYFYAVPPDLQNPQAAAPGNAFFLASLLYPVFNPAPTLTLYPNLDPLAPLVPTRTFLAFSGADAGQTGTAAPVDVLYNSTMGDAFTLQPLTGADVVTTFAALAFTPNQQASIASQADPYYLVPRGDFKLLPPRSGTVNLMCGLSGVEYTALEPDANILSFFQNQSAFATGFYPQQPPGFTSLVPTTLPTTSFASVTTPSSTVQYYAQPDQSVLYNYGNGDVAAAVNALAAVPVQAATINWPPVSTLTFPMMPYSGLAGADLDTYQQMESQVLSPKRKAALAAAPPQSPMGARSMESASSLSTTPQGLLASYVPGSSATLWERIVLAQMPGGQQFQLTSVQNELLSAFQSNKMFLVVSDPASIASSLLPADAQIIIGADPSEAWNFNIDPAVWASVKRPGTILIIKFYNMSIADLAKQPSMWASASTFNTSPLSTSATVGAIIADADPDDPDFAAFLNAVNNPNWNGILILNATAPLDELPAQLQGLAAGIDPGLFFAHHVGINASKINVPEGGGDLGISDSSIFGLINYQAPAPLRQSGANYQFQVATLKVLFSNSAVAGFSSKIYLQVNNLFGETAALEGSPDNIIQMFGVYQQHVVNGVTQDSYTFQTPTGQASTFVMSSNVLNVVQITQGQFVTVTSATTEDFNESQFLFWGLLDFKALGKFDLFSFGREADAPEPAGLNFSNLMVVMTSDPQTPDVPAVFMFDASLLAFDMAGSKTRAGSFFDHFPLTLASFTQGKNGTTPSGLGYMGVQTPLTQSTLSYPWYSLDFNVNLGSPGALAAQVGFIASITAAWAPNSGATYSVFTGLKLPGSNGSKRQITIQGLFNITFKTLEIIALQDSTTFILVLYGIGFSFLGFTFPPTGQVNFVLFGDPGQSASGSTSLGWYAAYAKPSTQTTGGTGRSGMLGSPTMMISNGEEK